MVQVIDFWCIDTHVDVLLDVDGIMMNMPVQIDNLFDDPHHHWVVRHIVLAVVVLNQYPHVVKFKLRLTIQLWIMSSQILKEGP